jgi:hypothetical protein
MWPRLDFCQHFCHVFEAAMTYQSFVGMGTGTLADIVERSIRTCDAAKNRGWGLPRGKTSFIHTLQLSNRRGAG